MNTNIVPRVSLAAAAALSALLLAACGTTTVDRTWAAPDLTNVRFKKVMVIATIPDGSARRAAEDAMKAQITGAEAVQSYRVLAGEADVKDAVKVTNAIKAQGVDGVIVMRGVSDRTEVSSMPSAMPPMGYRSFGSYYSAGYALGGYHGETIVTDRILSVETNIYEMKTGQLVWSGMTSTANPGNVKQLVEDAAKAIRSELVRKNLIPAPAK